MYGYFCKWLLYLSQQPNGKKLLSIIPEYYVEDASKFFKFWSSPSISDKFRNRGALFSREEVIRCILMLMGSESPLRNIYQRAVLIKVLDTFLPIDAIREQRLVEQFGGGIEAYKYENHEFNRFQTCKKELVGTLLQMYRDVERTGGHSQFFDKFRFRMDITSILKFLLNYEWHKKQLNILWSKDPKTFSGFLNMLINDLIYMLDHGLDELADIHTVELLMDNSIEWNKLNDEEKKEKEEELQDNKNGVKFHMALANESIALVRFLCNYIAQPFLSDDIILPRMAVLVSVYIDRLTGRGGELKVKGKNLDYNFKPKFLLTTVVEVFLCLSQYKDESGEKLGDSFLDAIIEDDAHFKPSDYRKGIRILRNRNLMAISSVDIFENELVKLEKKLQEKQNIDAILGDIPDEYLDPIMMTLMRDPVKFTSPKTGQVFVMDRKVIERHLLNNGNNPFTREKLTSDDLTDHSQLKSEIDNWIKDSLAKHKAKQENKDKDKDKDKEKEQKSDE